ncbi:unnamed protein product [Arabis nemorensis]|uniref:Uncharacterized protein n=1 Tax=Arabis nemorensis TaxID=586526 RepID=A0A565CB56_9BRAS|nr:unnamed protein product [Arabis nemorensis]
MVSINEGWQPLGGPRQLPRDPPSSFPQVIESDEEVEQVKPFKRSASRGKAKMGSSSKQGNPDKWDRLTTAIEDQGKF